LDPIRWIEIRRMRLNRYAIKSRPSVMDRAVQAEGTRGRRRDSPEQAFRGGGSPEFAVSGLPGVDLSGAGV